MTSKNEAIITANHQRLVKTDWSVFDQKAKKKTKPYGKGNKAEGRVSYSCKNKKCCRQCSMLSCICECHQV